MLINNDPDTVLALKEAVSKAGGQNALGRKIKRKQPTIWKWLNKTKKAPAEEVLNIEKATGVQRWRLRPDIFPPPKKS